MKNMKKKNNKGFFKGLVTGLLILIVIVGAKKFVIPASATEKPADSVTATDVATETETTTETTEATTAVPQSNGGERKSTTTAPSYDEVEADDGEYPTWDWDVSFDDTPSDSEDNSSDSAPSEPEVVAAAVDPYVAPLGEISWVWLEEVKGMAYLQGQPFTDGTGRHLTYAEATDVCGGISQAEFWQISEELLIETHTNVVFSQPQKGKFISLHKVYDPDTGNVTAF